MLKKQLQTEPVPAVLNHEYLAGLQRHLGTAHACELLADGTIDLMGSLDRLSEAAGQGDDARIAALAHEIVSAAGHLGLGLMSYLAAQTSMAAHDGKWRDWVDALLDVRSRIDRRAARLLCARLRRKGVIAQACVAPAPG